MICRHRGSFFSSLKTCKSHINGAEYWFLAHAAIVINTNNVLYCQLFTDFYSALPTQITPFQPIALDAIYAHIWQETASAPPKCGVYIDGKNYYTLFYREGNHGHKEIKRLTQVTLQFRNQTEIFTVLVQFLNPKSILHPMPWAISLLNWPCQNSTYLQLSLWGSSSNLANLSCSPSTAI